MDMLPNTHYHYLKDLPTGKLKEKANYYNNSLPNGGGEGSLPLITSPVFFIIF